MLLKTLTCLLLLLSILSWTPSAHAVLLTDSIIGYWSLDEASGTRANTFGSNDLVAHGDVSSTPGVVGNAAEFDAANNEYLDGGDAPELSSGSNSFTVMGWAYVNSSSGEGIIASKYGRVTPTQEWYFIYLPTDSVLQFRVRESPETGGNSRIAELPIPFTPDVWHFVVGWYDFGARTINLQVDNGPVTTTSGIGIPADTTVSFLIGALAWNTPIIFWDGKIDGVGLWQRTLVEEERTLLYDVPGVLVGDMSPRTGVIPEPSSLMLLGSGLLAGVCRRKKRSY